ncbi:uncharacterized protein DNG_01974 [Cephalotrichum gorgonifer]|uniref:MARVEL domain-containing protein n=1 Tax=Cephalotrichum gorgonifer TaxID=2041049 RepID=A0AAE8SSA4_9PEZI|nr:uncharacterized protein DNG_01974 [Cephalotrichum gorgonifer]
MLQTPALNKLQIALRSLQLATSFVVLAIYSYTLGALSNRSLPTGTSVRAVEGIAGISVGYAIACIILVRLARTRTFPAFVLIVLDVAFAAAWIYVASANGGGAGSCSGKVKTHFGTGEAGDDIKGKTGGFMALGTYGDACRLLTACLSMAILIIFMYLGSIAVTIFLGRDHHAQKRKIISSEDPLDDPSSYPPLDSPKPDYTEEPAKRGKFSLKNLFGRRGTARRPQDPDNVLPQHTQPSDVSFRRSSFQAGDDYAHVNHHLPGAPGGVGRSSDISMTGASGGRSGYQRVSGPYEEEERPISPETIYAEYEPTRPYATPSSPPPPPQAASYSQQPQSDMWRPVDITGGARTADLGEMYEVRFPHGPYENLRPASTRNGAGGRQPQAARADPAGYRYADGVYNV